MEATNAAVGFHHPMAGNFRGKGVAAERLQRYSVFQIYHSTVQQLAWPLRTLCILMIHHIESMSIAGKPREGCLCVHIIMLQPFRLAPILAPLRCAWGCCMIGEAKQSDRGSKRGVNPLA